MKLEQLMESVPFTLVQGSLDTEIADIIYDSRKAAPGLLFVCIVGTQRDSHAFAADCAAKGVSALVIQHDIDLSTLPGVTVVKVESSRYALALMSGNLFGNPSRRMTMIGVTGTKGKTTTTHMIKSVLEAAGRKVGMIGTNGIYFMGRHQETANTTPESYELQKTFRQFLDAGCDVALMEVSSQGLMMDRVAGVHYDVGVFTNLSPDHIGPGEHKTFEEYRSWKGQLFKRCDVGVVNIDDENTAALLEAMDSGKVSGYMTDFPSEDILGRPGIVCTPHLGASTPEAEDNCAVMAAQELSDYLRNGNITHSVNLPEVHQPRAGGKRICIIHKNEPGMISQITALTTEAGLNIENMVNKSKKNMAYTMLDATGAVDARLSEKLSSIPAVIRVRIL